MAGMDLPTSLVGSYAQPDWLIDREKLAARFPPRVRARELWRVDPRFLEEAQDDATLLAVRDQERAGLDIVTDGEQRRARRWTAAGTQIRCRAWSGRSSAGIRYRSAISRSSRPTPIARSR
jgi:methionine synthase II (cobalamin-independent)